jgi:hypothetical protein
MFDGTKGGRVAPIGLMARKPRKNIGFSRRSIPITLPACRRGLRQF